MNLLLHSVNTTVYFENKIIVEPFTKVFPGGSEGKVSACNAGDPGSIPGLGKSLGERNDNRGTLACKIPWTEKSGSLQSM